MKIRNGFVSNSSSSSFVILINKPGCCPTCGLSAEHLIEIIGDSDERYISDSFDDEIEEINENIKSYDETIALGKNDCSYHKDMSDEEYIAHHCRQRKWREESIQRLKKIEGYKERGAKTLHISYHETGLDYLLRRLEKLGVIEILEDCG